MFTFCHLHAFSTQQKDYVVDLTVSDDDMLIRPLRTLMDPEERGQHHAGGWVGA